MVFIDRESNRFVDEETIFDAVAASGVLEAGRIVVYSGGGISATMDAAVSAPG